MAAPRPLRLLLVACAAWMLAYELHVVALPGIDAGALFSRFVHDVVLVVAAVVCLARVPAARGSERLAWALIGSGVLAWAVGEIYYTAVLWEDPAPPMPSPADVGYLLFPPLTMAGALVLLRARTRGVPRGLLLDGVTAALGVTAVSAAIVFETVVDLAAGDRLAVVTALAYPLTDLVLLGVVVGALASSGWWLDRTWLLLAAGVTTFWLADSLFLVQTTQGVYESGGWFDAGWWAGLTMVAAAAWQPPAARLAEPVDERVRTIAVPLSFGAVGLGVLVYGAIAGINLLAVGLAAASILAVMARATLTFGQNVAMLRRSRDEALTDALTGLGNRRALTRTLAQLLPKATHERPLALALFDLDGFKQYNDTFGHPAGDALLVRLGGNLRAHLQGRGRAFRMGGDEFCAIFDGELHEPLIRGAAAALTERGDSFSITCSHGVVVLPLEADDAVDALRIADQRMYAAKQVNRTSAGRQSADVLLRALAERDPGLGTHAEAVELAVATAQALALAPDEVEHVRQASELHDVGKVAIPDAILGKPGSLTEEEWAFVRRHPIIGERIILGAPALARVAALVRASHERWDGAGYPDALAGDAIPLGARIVAVADAYAAMTAGRPYRAARAPEQALNELRRGAGTQFDPTVVEAWCAAYDRRGLPAAV